MSLSTRVNNIITEWWEQWNHLINDIAIIDSTGVVFKDGSAYLYENVRGEVWRSGLLFTYL